MTSGPTKTSIVFFGTEDFSLASLEALVEHGFTVAAVVTKPDSPQGRGHKLTPPKVKRYAQAHGIPVWQPAKLADIAHDIASLDRPAGVLVSYGKIIPQSIIDLFTPGIINLHPSLLPAYRGPSPIESAILHGDAMTGISIMQLSAEMDAGPVYRQVSHQLADTETAPELYDTLGAIGVKELVRTLPHILDGTLQPAPQDSERATYCSLISKADGIIDWQLPAAVIERQIRAYTSWPGSRTTLSGVEVIVARASAVHMDDTATPGEVIATKAQLFVGTGQDWLEIHRLKPVGKKEMPVKAFLSGYSVVSP